MRELDISANSATRAILIVVLYGDTRKPYTKDLSIGVIFVKKNLQSRVPIIDTRKCIHSMISQKCFESRDTYQVGTLNTKIVMKK